MAEEQRGVRIRGRSVPGEAQGRERPRFRIRAWAIAVWILLWQAASLLMGSSLLLPAPTEVVIRVVELASEAEFWRRVSFTLLRIAEGFAAGMILGVVFASFAMRFHRIGELLAPAMALAKSVPVVCFVVLALVWVGASDLSVVVVVLVVLPIMYENLCDGVRSVDAHLIEMARLLRVPTLRRLRLIYLPQALPFFRAACASSLGMAWKAGVAAEVIAIPAGSMGEALYGAKIYFDTTGLFAWTLAVVCLSVLFERVFVWLMEIACSVLAGDARTGHGVRDDFISPFSSSASIGLCARSFDSDVPSSVVCCFVSYRDVSKFFEGTAGFSGVSFSASSKEPICLMAPSGFGKTTLLRMAAGLERPDGGSVAFDGFPRGHARMSMAFQEDRLIEHVDAFGNASIALRHASMHGGEVVSLLEDLGVSDCIGKPARLCSGGQRRRIALARALLAPHDVLLLDEPFAGLDDDSRERAASVVRRFESGNTVVIIASHDERDACLLGARIVKLAE